MSLQTLTALLLDKDDKLDLRLPKGLKRQLKSEAKEKGFKKLSKYVLAIIIERGSK